LARSPQPIPDFEARSASIREVFALGRFEPARAQRDYQWGADQWNDLWNDLLNVFSYAKLDPGMGAAEADAAEPPGSDEADTGEPMAALKHKALKLEVPDINSFYLGHVLLFRRTDPGRFFIYDGQQRITTLTLMLCAMRDAEGAAGEWEAIQSILRTPAPENLARLQHEGERNALAHIVSRLNGVTSVPGAWVTKPQDRRVIEAAQWFLNRLRGWPQARRRAFLSLVMDRVNVSLTFIRDRRVAEYAYITINTRGKPLENKDIIKGHLVQLASLKSLGAATAMADGWDKVEKAGGRQFPQLLRTAYLLDFRSAPGFDFGAQIMDRFAEQDSLPDATDWVERRLPALVTRHTALTRPGNREGIVAQPFADIRRLAFLPFHHWKAILFRMDERDRKAPERFRRDVGALLKWGVCMNLLGIEDERLTRMTIEALEWIDDGRNPFSNGGGPLRLSASWRERVKTRIRDGQITDDERRGAHVRWLETLYWPNDGIDFASVDGSSVEHLLPRSATGQWLVDFPDAIHIHTERFGNLCMVPKDLNRQLGNQQWPEKRPLIAALPPTYRSAHDVASSEGWNVAAVDARTARLTALATKALGL
jgi:hypothetical protein